MKTRMSYQEINDIIYVKRKWKGEEFVIMFDSIDLQRLLEQGYTNVGLVKKRKKLYAKAIRKSDNKEVYLHRFIMNAKEDEIIHHRNTNPLDCTRLNLMTTDEFSNNRFLYDEGFSLFKHSNKSKWILRVFTKENDTMNEDIFEFESYKKALEHILFLEN